MYRQLWNHYIYNSPNYIRKAQDFYVRLYAEIQNTALEIKVLADDKNAPHAALYERPILREPKSSLPESISPYRQDDLLQSLAAFYSVLSGDVASVRELLSGEDLTLFKQAVDTRPGYEIVRSSLIIREDGLVFETQGKQTRDEHSPTVKDGPPPQFHSDIKYEGVVIKKDSVYVLFMKELPLNSLKIIFLTIIREFANNGKIQRIEGYSIETCSAVNESREYVSPVALERGATHRDISRLTDAPVWVQTYFKQFWADYYSVIMNMGA